MKIGIDTSKIDISMKQNRMTVLVVFADKNRANWYMENCFEYYTRVLVTSMDGIFPKHPELKTDVKKLWRDNNANLIVFGTHCIENNPPAGNVFSFDKWAIEYARRRSNVVQRSVANLDWADDPIRIARMVQQKRRQLIQKRKRQLIRRRRQLMTRRKLALEKMNN